jgi:hypothetical protein
MTMPEKPKESKKVRTHRVTLAEWLGVKRFLALWRNTGSEPALSTSIVRKPILKPRGGI